MRRGTYHTDVVTVKEGLSELGLLLLAVCGGLAVGVGKTNDKCFQVICQCDRPATSVLRRLCTYYSVTSSSTMSVQMVGE